MLCLGLVSLFYVNHNSRRRISPFSEESVYSDHEAEERRNRRPLPPSGISTNEYYDRRYQDSMRTSPYSSSPSPYGSTSGSSNYWQISPESGSRGRSHETLRPDNTTSEAWNNFVVSRHGCMRWLAVRILSFFQPFYRNMKVRSVCGKKRKRTERNGAAVYAVTPITRIPPLPRPRGRRLTHGRQNILRKKRPELLKIGKKRHGRRQKEIAGTSDYGGT